MNHTDPAPVWTGQTTDPVPAQVWAGFDWSQAELALLALFAHDAKLRAALESADIHRAMAADVFETAPDRVQSVEREASKTIIYALIYCGFDLDTAIAIARNRVGAMVPSAILEKAVHAFPEKFDTLFAWVEAALYKWHADRGYVSYLMGAKRLIRYPDYLKPDIGSLRRSKEGRIAINTYGQNSVGLLLKFYLAQVRQHGKLRARTAHHIPLFDAHYCTIQTEHLAETLETLATLATPVLCYNGFEVRMRADWKLSMQSWGDLRKIDLAAADIHPAAEPWRLSWDDSYVMPTIEPSAANPFAAGPPVSGANPFAQAVM